MEKMEETFLNFSGGKPDMDGRSFVKVMKDAGLVDKAFKSTDADLIFTKVKPRGLRKIGFEDFLGALGEVALKKKLDEEAVVSRVLAAGERGPQLNGGITTHHKDDEVVGPARFYYDKQSFTGVHQKGGPQILGGSSANVAFSNLIHRDAIQDDALQRRKYGDPAANPRRAGEGQQPAAAGGRRGSGGGGGNVFNPPSRAGGRRGSQSQLQGQAGKQEFSPSRRGSSGQLTTKGQLARQGSAVFRTPKGATPAAPRREGGDGAASARLQRQLSTPHTGGKKDGAGLGAQYAKMSPLVRRSQHEANKLRAAGAPPKIEEDEVKKLRGPERFYYDQKSYTGAKKYGGGHHCKDDGYSDLSALISRDHVQNDSIQRKKYAGKA